MNFLFINVAYASLDSFIGNVDRLIINPLISLMVALAVLFFLFGVFQFLANSDDEEAKTTGKSHMLWGIVGLVIMFGVWGILSIVLNTLGITGIDPEHSNVHLNDYTPSRSPTGSRN